MSLDTRLLDLEISNENERELGPLKYLAETTGRDMDQVVNWFLLLIIFVFDPLAIAMVIAANFAFAQIKPTTKFGMSEVTQEEVFAILDAEDDPHKMDNEDLKGTDLTWVSNDITTEDIKNQFIKPGQEEMIKRNEEVLATPKEDIYKENAPPPPDPVVKGKTAYW